MRSNHKRHKKNDQEKNVLEITNADSLKHLPKAQESSLEELFISIDSAVQKRFIDLCHVLAPQIAHTIDKNNLNLKLLEIDSAVSLEKIEEILEANPRIPDIDETARICSAIGTKLRLSIISKKNPKAVLCCDAHLNKPGKLEFFLRQNIDSLDIHPLAKEVFQRFGLQAAEGLDGGSLEKAVPQLFRLMRLSLFMRCHLALSVVPSDDTQAEAQFLPAA